MRIPEVPLKLPFLGTEGPSPTRAGKSEDMQVIGPAQAGRSHFLLMACHSLVGNLLRLPSPKKGHYVTASHIQPVQLRRQLASDDKAAIPILKPVQDWDEVRMRRAGEDCGSQVRVDDHAQAGFNLAGTDVPLPERSCDTREEH
jgi:hypothetical protein